MSTSPSGVARAGAADPLVVVVAFEDYQHPLAARLAQSVDRAVARWPSQVEVQYRHLAPAFHPQAGQAAAAARRAQGTGRFGRARAALIASRDRWNWDDEALAATLSYYGLQSGSRDQDEAGVADDLLKAAQLGVQVDPDVLRGAVIVNGIRVDAREYASLARTIAVELGEAQKLVEGEVTRAQAVRARWAQNAGSQRAAAWVLDDAPVSTEERAAAGKLIGEWGAQATRERYKVEVRPDDPRKGSAEALVTIVEFSDFQCPFCTRVGPTLDALLELYPGQIRVLFKHLPLPFHPAARPAALAAECARAQGNPKFWAFHDALYARVQALPPGSDLPTRASAAARELAAEQGLDLGRFDTCLGDPTTAARVDQDRGLAGRTGARGTPSLFINGRRVAGALPLNSMRAILHEELKAVRASGGGLTGDALYARLLEAAKVETPLGEKAHTLDLAGAPRLGRPEAPVQITVFSDYQCPYCSAIDGPLTEAQRQLPDDISLTFKHFPLDFHERARPAAIAAVCAQAQGKFWELGAELFAHRQALGDKDLEGHARKVGLEVEGFVTCLSSPEAAARVDADIEEGKRAGVEGTPTILVNGRTYSGSLGRDAAAFKRLAEQVKSGAWN